MLKKSVAADEAFLRALVKNLAADAPNPPNRALVPLIQALCILSLSLSLSAFNCKLGRLRQKEEERELRGEENEGRKRKEEPKRRKGMEDTCVSIAKGFLFIT